MASSWSRPCPLGLRTGCRAPHQLPCSRLGCSGSSGPCPPWPHPNCLLPVHLPYKSLDQREDLAGGPDGLGPHRGCGFLKKFPTDFPNVHLSARLNLEGGWQGAWGTTGHQQRGERLSQRPAGVRLQPRGHWASGTHPTLGFQDLPQHQPQLLQRRAFSGRPRDGEEEDQQAGRKGGGALT